MLIGQCSSSNNTHSNSMEISNFGADSTLEPGTNEITPPPLDVSAVDRGGMQAQAVSRLDLVGGEETYSRNCYDLVSSNFDWHELDRCGGFDATVARWNEAAGMASDPSDYFNSETTASRYLAQATGHDLAATDADQRWEAVKGRIIKLSKPAVRQVQSRQTEEVSGVVDEQDEILMSEPATNEGRLD